MAESKRGNVYQAIFMACHLQSGKTELSLHDFWLRARLQVWERGENFVDRVDNKTLRTLYFSNFLWKKQHFNVTNEKLVNCFPGDCPNLYFATAYKNFRYLFSHKYSLHIASILWETHWIYKQESLVAGIGSLVFLTV